MERLKLDQETLELSSLMERITNARVKDCFKDEANETIYLVVAPGELGKAVGKGGSNIRLVQEKIGKKVRVIEFNDNLASFVRNLIYPLNVAEIKEEAGDVIIRDDNKKTKSLLIGREGRNLKLLNRAVRRFFSVNEVKVI